MQPLILRSALPGDALGIATVQIRSWRAAYASALDPGWLAALRPVDWAARHRQRIEDPESPRFHTVATHAGRIVGFVSGGPPRPREGESIPADWSEVYALYVDPDRFGHGIGFRLMASARDTLLERGFRRLMLWVMEGNDRAVRFYARQGLRLDGERKEDGFDGAGEWVDLRCSAPLDAVAR